MSLEVFPGRYWAVLNADMFEEYFPSFREVGWKILANQKDENTDNLWFAFEVPQKTLISGELADNILRTLTTIPAGADVHALDPQSLGVFETPEPSWIDSADNAVTAAQEMADSAGEAVANAASILEKLAWGIGALGLGLWLMNRNK